MNRRQVGRNAGNDRAADDLGDIRHVKLEARRGARSPATGRVEPGSLGRPREGGDHDQAVHTWIANEATSTRNFGKVRSNRGSVWAVNISKLTSSLKKLGHQTKSRAIDHSD